MRRVGLDLGIRSAHRAAICEDSQPIGRAFRVEKTRAGIDSLLERATRGTSEPCEFVMEPTGLQWVVLAAELKRQGHRPFVPKPQKTHALRKFYSNFAKTDGKDARAAAMLRHVDPDGVYELDVPRPEQMMLRMFVKQRARWVEMAASAKQRIQCWLELGNPHLHTAFRGDLFCQAGRAFLKRYVDPWKALGRGQKALVSFLQRNAHGVFSVERCEAVLAACVTTCEFYGALHDEDALPFDYELLQELIAHELDHIVYLEKKVDAAEEKIARLYAELDPTRVLEKEVPGVGPAIAPTIEAFIGNVERFPNIDCFCAYSGMVPRTKQTGVNHGRSGQRITKSGPPLLRHYLFLAAEIGRRLDPELAYAYQKAIDSGHHHYSAVVIAAHKLTRKVYALLKLRTSAERAAAEGRPVPAVEYLYFHPETRKPMTRKEARAWTAAFRGASAESAEAVQPQHSGSLESATTGLNDAPPKPVVAEPPDCGNSVEDLVEELLKKLRASAPRVRLKPLDWA